MKKVFCFIALICVIGLTSCNPNIYLAPNFEKIRTSQHKLAILPFDVLIKFKKMPKGYTQEIINEQQKSTGFSIQSNAYSYFLKEKAKDKYTIDFQDIDQTNALLTKAGIDYETIKTMGKDEICAALGVDGVISGKATMAKPMSEAAAVAVGLLVGYWGTTDQVNVTMNIHDKNGGTLLWKYDYQASGGVGNSAENLTRALMRNASKNFPYKK
jgi:hypothetical protein